MEKAHACGWRNCKIGVNAELFRRGILVIYEVIITQTNHLIRTFFLLRWLSSPGQSSHSGIFLGEMTLFPKSLESVIFFRHFFCGDDSVTQTIHLIQAFFSVRWFSASSQSSHSGIFLSEMTQSPKLPKSLISFSRFFPQRWPPSPTSVPEDNKPHTLSRRSMRS